MVKKKGTVYLVEEPHVWTMEDHVLSEKNHVQSEESTFMLSFFCLFPYAFHIIHIDICSVYPKYADKLFLYL